MLSFSIQANYRRTRLNLIAKKISSDLGRSSLEGNCRPQVSRWDSHLNAWWSMSSSPRFSPSFSFSVQISITKLDWFSHRKSNAEIPESNILSLSLFSVRYRLYRPSLTAFFEAVRTDGWIGTSPKSLFRKWIFLYAQPPVSNFGTRGILCQSGRSIWTENFIRAWMMNRQTVGSVVTTALSGFLT